MFLNQGQNPLTTQPKQKKKRITAIQQTALTHMTY